MSYRDLGDEDPFSGEPMWQGPPTPEPRRLVYRVIRLSRFGMRVRTRAQVISEYRSFVAARYVQQRLEEITSKAFREGRIMYDVPDYMIVIRREP